MPGIEAEPAERKESKCEGCGAKDVDVAAGRANSQGKFYCSHCWELPAQGRDGKRWWPSEPEKRKEKRGRRCAGRGFGLDRFCSCGITPGETTALEDKDYFGKDAYFSKSTYDLDLPQELIGQSYTDAHCHLDFLLQNIRCGSVEWTWKTIICDCFANDGHCPWGDECGFAHGEDDLWPRYPLVADDLRSFAQRHPVAGIQPDSNVDNTALSEECGMMSPPLLRRIVTNSCDVSSIEDGIFLSKVSTPYLGASVYVTFGCHPHTYTEFTADAERQLLNAVRVAGKRCVGIGECGLDYAKNYSAAGDPESRRQMLKVFERQAEISVELCLPLVVHSRDADEDTLRILRQLPRDHRVHVHAFQNSVQMMNEVLELMPNSVFGVSGLLLTPKVQQEVVDIAMHCPLGRMVLESDAPFLISEPRGIPLVAMKIAELRGVSVAEVLAVTNENSERFYDIPLNIPNGKP